MTKKFYRMTLSVLESEIAVNADSIMAVIQLPNNGANHYRVWLTGPLPIAADISKRIAQLGGVTPLTQDWWDVTSSDFGDLFTTA
ncbi:hypothetical protein KW842_13990 [Duganella sp. sic0402]|uniref:hypothetical protein n=1 Tax=Duganella sp. sic0402 TaxID=2854786 RepID=UPI001C446870|nr:hypothetical protein [Duganella sp. sic0402]MBV7536876.1 hypothetical protein [Duganella sp. sic0402]